MLNGWKKNTPAVGPIEQQKFVKAGLLKPEECLLRLRDVDTGKEVVAHAGSAYWNEYRQRWVLITTEFYGTSLLGEVWFAEADTPLGPWCYARKVVTHDDYSFYNGQLVVNITSPGCGALSAWSKYSHTWSDVSINGVSIGYLSIGLSWSSSNSRWGRAADTASSTTYPC